MLWFMITNNGRLFFYRLREIIVFEIEQESHGAFDGEIDVDESFFGGYFHVY
jgi:transposase